MIGTILTCGIRGERCPFNWDILVEGGEMIGYIRYNCPCERYEERERNYVCKWAKEVKR